MHRRVCQQKRACSLADSLTQRIEIETPFALLWSQWHQLRHSSSQTHAINHSRIGWICEDHFIAWICCREQYIENAFRAAAGDDDFISGMIVATDLIIKPLRD